MGRGECGARPPRPSPSLLSPPPSVPTLCPLRVLSAPFPGPIHSPPPSPAPAVSPPQCLTSAFLTSLPSVLRPPSTRPLPKFLPTSCACLPLLPKLKEAVWVTGRLVMRGKVWKPSVCGGSDGEVGEDTCRLKGRPYMSENTSCCLLEASGRL